MKKIISLVLTLLMVLGLTSTAYATNGETTYNYNYEIYQIFTGEFVGNVLTNVEWGENSAIPANASDDLKASFAEKKAVPQSILDELEAVDNTASNEIKLAVILKYADLSTTPFATLQTNDSTATLTVSTDGYYLIKDANQSQSGENGFYTTYIVKVVDGTVTINRKGDHPGVVKKIVEGSNLVDKNEASIGDTITYQIEGTLPSNIADYNTYYYKFVDTLSAGLDYVGITSITVGGVELKDFFYVDAKENMTEDRKTSTTLIVGIEDLLALEQLVEKYDITTETKVVVTYTATLNANAVIGGIGNPNEVYLQYSNDPNNDGSVAGTAPSKPDKEPTTSYPTGVTPKDEVVTYTTEIIINKVDQDNNILAGASFEIEGVGVKMVVVKKSVYEKYNEGVIIDQNNCYWLLNDGTYTTTAPNTENEEYYADTTTKYYKETKVTIDSTPTDAKVEAFVGDDGIVKFTGLGAGTYTITETVVPAGYNSISAINVTIGWAEDSNTDGCTWSYEWSNDSENNNNTNQVTVFNQKGSTLPTTGGAGTTMFYLAGGIMVLAAVVLLVTKKRMNNEE